MSRHQLVWIEIRFYFKLGRKAIGNSSRTSTSSRPLHVILRMAYRYRDAFGRVSFVEESDAFREHLINPKDGRLTKVIVQGAPIGNKEDDDNDDGDIFKDNDESNWTRIRTPQTNISLIMALVYWAYSSVLVEGTEKRRWNWLSTIIVAAKWIPTCLVLALMVSFPKLD